MTSVMPVRNPSEEPVQHDPDRYQVDPSAAGAEATERFWEAIVAARKLLTDTVDAVDPDTSAEELLKIVKDYRAHLAEIVAVLPVPGGDSA